MCWCAGRQQSLSLWDATAAAIARRHPPPPQPRPPPRAAQVLEGLEKAERNLLPILNNLLENREMAVRATLLLLGMP